MAWENPHDVLESVLAGESLVHGQDLFVNVDNTGRVVVNTIAGGPVDGVLLNKPDTNQPASVALGGRCIVTVGAKVDVGALVTSDNQGRAITAGLLGPGEIICGKALSAATNPGEKITIILKTYGVFIPLPPPPEGGEN